MSAVTALLFLTSGCALTLVKCRHSEPVVQLALFRIRKNLIGLSNFLKFSLSLCIARIGIRMIFFGQLSICTLYLFIVSSSGKSQNLVIISFHCGASSFQISFHFLTSLFVISYIEQAVNMVMLCSCQPAPNPGGGVLFFTRKIMPNTDAYGILYLAATPRFFECEDSIFEHQNRNEVPNNHRKS